MIERDGFDLHLSGPLRLLDARGRRVAIPSKRAMAMLAMLAAGRGERTRSWLQEKLWGARAEAQAQGSLRRELSNLKAVLARAGGGFVQSDHHRVWLDRERLRVHEDGAEAGGGGEFLEGFDLGGEEGFEDWLRTERAARAARRDAPAAAPAPSPPRGGASRALRRPSLAVVRFTGGADAPRREELADGVADEITVALSRFGTLRVLAAAPGDAAADYVLHGRVGLDEGRVRIWVRLVGPENRVVWTERFDETAADAFAVQDRLAVEVARQVDSAIEKEEMRRAVERPVDPDDAYAAYWRANALFRRWTRAALEEAVALCARAAELCPSHPWPHALSGFCRGVMLASGWSADLFAERARALGDADRALQLGSDDPSVLGYVAATLLVTGGEIEQARRVIERAAALGRGYPSLPFWQGWIELCSGDPRGGLEHLTAAAAINPRSAVRPFQQTGVGLCLLLLGRAGEALAPLEDSIHRMPDHPVTLAALAAALALLGRAEEAGIASERLRRVDPALLAPLIMRDPPLRQRWRDAIELAQSGAPPPSLRLVSAQVGM
ncbi:tetratricopeptide repeat protein [Sphingomonas lenta]|nr:hypothetical protein [Sphingomonas lenta]